MNDQNHRSRRSHTAVIGLLTLLACSCKPKTVTVNPPAAPPAIENKQSTSGDGMHWREASTPFPAANLTSVGKIFWICGANEMIASSSDGGNLWVLRHSRANGAILLNIVFVNENVGHAAGRGGVLLSTDNGGKTWKTHNANDDVNGFSFADANNGIAILGGDPDTVNYVPSWTEPSHSDGHVKLTHDGGDHWQDIPALNSDELKPYSIVLSVAALNPTHYLVMRKQKNIEDAFVSTADGGKTWKLVHQRNDDTNREMTRWLFVHEGEYWAFGMELLNRQQAGGYGAPLAMRSADGELWTHGVNGSKEFGGCNPQGCYMWDGAIESLYGKREQYWNTPRDSSLSTKWAVAADTICTLSSLLECGPAIATESPQPMSPHPGGTQFDLKRPTVNLPFARDCSACAVRPIWTDPGTNWSGRVKVAFSVDKSGNVYGVELDGLNENRAKDQIAEQIRAWTFKPSSDFSKRRSVLIDVRCIDVMDAPAIGGCRLTPAGPA